MRRSPCNVAFDPKRTFNNVLPTGPCVSSLRIAGRSDLHPAQPCAFDCLFHQSRGLGLFYKLGYVGEPSRMSFRNEASEIDDVQPLLQYARTGYSLRIGHNVHATCRERMSLFGTQQYQSGREAVGAHHLRPLDHATDVEIRRIPSRRGNAYAGLIDVSESLDRRVTQHKEGVVALHVRCREVDLGGSVRIDRQERHVPRIGPNALQDRTRSRVFNWLKFNSHLFRQPPREIDCRSAKLSGFRVLEGSGGSAQAEANTKLSGFQDIGNARVRRF